MRFRFVLMLAIIIGLLVSLELLSLMWNCYSSSISKSFSACDNRLYANDEGLKNLLKELSEKYRLGIPPSQEEMERAVIEVDRESIGGSNGIYCNGVAFVSNDLSAQAELYVRRHELEHAFQFSLEMPEENYESAANYAAAREYPIGMASTVVLSILEGRICSGFVSDSLFTVNTSH